MNDQAALGFSNMCFPLHALQRQPDTCQVGQSKLFFSSAALSAALQSGCAGPQARRQYQEFLTVLRARRHPEAADVSDDSHHKVHDGVFGALMDVSLVNDGPVTLTIDSDGTIGVTT